MSGDPFDCPLATHDLPGTGGYLINTPTHFIVDEIPAYPPTGDGPHWLIQIKKHSLGTPELRKIMAKAAQCPARDVGIAGRKDKHAITTQWISMPCSPVDPQDERIEILSATPHRNKLRMGHLRGNRFRIRISGVTDQAAMPQLLERIKPGIPNYFGTQRFGGDALQRGLALIESPRQRVRDPRFLASAVQSAVFNVWLAARVRADALHQALLGDILRVRATGGLFDCDDPAVDTPRVLAGEIDPTGPMPGPKMRTTSADALEQEQIAAAAFQLDDPDRLQALGRFGPGTRRLARLVPTDLSWQAIEDDIEIEFTLPKGAYATTVLTEIIHPGGPVERRFQNERST